MTRGALRRLFPEHHLHIGLAPPELLGSPEELFGTQDREHWFGIAERGRVQDLLKTYRINIAHAAQRGFPIIMAFQSFEDAVMAEEWLILLRPDWWLRHSLELLDEYEARGMIPTLAGVAQVG